MAKVYVVIREDEITYNKDETDTGVIETTIGATIEKIFTDEDQAVRYIRDTVQRWTEHYERKIEQAKTPFEKYRYACRLGGLKYLYDDIREGRYVNITDTVYYHYESHELE
jgi:hypothetical protein